MVDWTNPYMYRGSSTNWDERNSKKKKKCNGLSKVILVTSYTADKVEFAPDRKKGRVFTARY